MISDEQLRKKERLLKSKDFRLVYKKGRAFYGPDGKKARFALCSAPNGLGNSRIGFSISAKNIKLATRRNRIRRLFREVFRRNKKGLRAGFDIVIIVKKAPERAQVSYKEIEGIFLKLIKEAGILA